MAVLFLNIHDVFVQRIGASDIGGGDPVQDHVHDGDDIGERLLFLPVEGFGLERVKIGRRNVGGQHVGVSLNQEARRTTGPVINRLPDLGVNDLEHGADQRTRCVILAAIPPCVAHAFDTGFIEVGQFVLGLLRVELKPVHDLQHVAQRIARAEFVGDLRKVFPDLIFDGVRAGGVLAVFLEGWEPSKRSYAGRVSAAEGNAPL